MTCPAPTSHRRSATSVQLMIQFGLDHGLSLEHCLAGTGLDWQLLGDPGSEVNAAQELSLLRNIARGLGDRPGIGLDAGRRYRLNTYGIWGYALLSSSTYRSAVELGLRYQDLTYAFHGLRIDEVGDEAQLHLIPSSLPEDLRGFVLERDVSGALSVHRDLAGGGLPVRRACFALPAPADTTPWRALLGVEPTFGAAHNCITFDRALLDLPLPGANPQAAAYCEAQCRALLDRRRQRDGFASRIRDLLLGRPGQRVDMESLAAQLYMTSRTLRRRLDAEGTSFRQLQDEVLGTLAEELLRSTALRLEEIAERLGYGEVSNFIHAFKRWKGVSPGQFRREAHAPR
ncbi:AraC family transcriptional regulator [Metapseudomonas otitidis]|uniref:AraC family transcriptional regulator n=1 Tax=Metapseudomonas otitidis TaxID=319939 RepID=UPI001F38A82C|nr:AraC family transcriptional regulator [Pseudomonas otitidis]